MSTNPDEYYLRKEVSNSDLTALKNEMYGQHIICDREKIFAFGSLVDAIVTERERVNFLSHSVDGVIQDEADWNHAMSMRKALFSYANTNPFMAWVLKNAETQKVSILKDHPFSYEGIDFALDTRCKWDWFIPQLGFGGDLKTTSASTENEFLQAIDVFDWDRSRAWYMDIVGSNEDFICAVSKKNNKVFFQKIDRESEIYKRGRKKYEELAFYYWMYFVTEK